MDIKEPIRLKPISFSLASRKSLPSMYHDNKLQQMILLKSLAITTDPNELKKMIGVRTVSEVYRTLDKLALRKEYHNKLLELGIDFGFILQNYKEIIETGKNKDKLVALGALLKSLGMHEYNEKSTPTSSSWEETLLKSIENDQSTSMKSLSAGKSADIDQDYEVNVPKEPKFNPVASTEELSTLQDLYESRNESL